MADLDDVLRCNTLFYEAFNQRDMTLMESVWMHDGRVRCVHPGWGILEGWEEVRASFEKILGSGLAVIEVSDVEPFVADGEPMAWVTCIEEISYNLEGNIITARAQATNIFEKEGGRWLMVHHHASAVPVQLVSEEVLQ